MLLVAGGASVRLHRAELVTTEGFASAADASLREQNRAGRTELDEEADQHRERHEERQREHEKAKIKRPLPQGSGERRERLDWRNYVHWQLEEPRHGTGVQQAIEPGKWVSARCRT